MPASNSAPTQQVTLRDGTVVELRPATPADGERVAMLLKSLSVNSRALRFGTAAVGLHAAALASLQHRGLIALSPEGAVIGHIWYERTREGRADVAIVVADAYQGRGLGTTLLRTLTRDAARDGIRTLEAFVLPHNARMHGLLRNCRLPVRIRAEFAGTTFEISTVDEAREAA